MQRPANITAIVGTQPGWAFVEVVILWLAIAATTWAFFRRSPLAARWLAPGALLGLGQLRRRVELHYLAVQSGLVGTDRRCQVPAPHRAVQSQFEMDFDDGEIGFQVSQILDGDAVGEAVIDRMIGTAVNMLETYLPSASPQCHPPASGNFWNLRLRREVTSIWPPIPDSAI
jgi:hypothetical protein